MSSNPSPSTSNSRTPRSDPVVEPYRHRHGRVFTPTSAVTVVHVDTVIVDASSDNIAGINQICQTISVHIHQPQTEILTNRPEKRPRDSVICIFTPAISGVDINDSLGRRCVPTINKIGETVAINIAKTNAAIIIA